MLRRTPLVVNCLTWGSLLLLAACVAAPDDSAVPGARSDGGNNRLTLVPTQTTAPDGQVTQVAGTLPPNLPGGSGSPGTTTVAGGTATSQPTTAAGIPTPLPSTAASRDGDGRATADLPDDANQLQVHLVYVLPSDGQDERLDLDGTIERSFAAANSWLSSASGGATFRVDSYQGKPDVTFFRSAHTDAELADSEVRLRTLEKELQGAGFLDATKLYAMYYGGGSAAAPTSGNGDPIELGLGGSGYGALWFKQCGTCALASDATRPGPYEYTIVHEILHGLGFVPTGAPHVSDTHHVTDDPNDIMSAVQTLSVPTLDAGHNDYFKANLPGVLDLSTSPFLAWASGAPAVVPPTDRPMTRVVPSDAVAYKPAITETTLPGATDLEGQLAAALNAARAAAGKPALQVDPTLRMLARAEASAGTADPTAALRGQVGVAGPASYEGFASGNSNVLGAFQASPAFAELASSDTVTGIGVGVIVAGGVYKVEWATTETLLSVDSVSVGTGDGDTYTIAAQLSSRTGKDVPGNVFVDGKGYVIPFVVKGAGPSVVFASVPKGGSHHVMFGQQSGDNHYTGAADYTVDAAKPVDQALSIR